MSVGKRLREERERLGLPQDRFAAVGGVGKRAQINYESDERSPDASYLAGVAVIGVNVLYVITGLRAEAPPPPITSEQMLLLDAYQEAAPAVRKAALAALLSGASAITAGMTYTGDGGVLVGGKTGRVSVKTKK